MGKKKKKGKSKDIHKQQYTYDDILTIVETISKSMLEGVDGTKCTKCMTWFTERAPGIVEAEARKLTRAFKKQAKRDAKVREVALKLARDFQESIEDPKLRKKAEEYYQKISSISQEDLNRRFTI